MKIQINHSIKLDNGIIINSALITVLSANDNYEQKNVSISVKIENEGVSIGIDIGKFIYSETWGDFEVQEFITKWAKENAE